MAYQDEWNLISGSKAYGNLSDADKRKLGRIFARKVVAPEVGGGKSPEMRAFIEAYVAPKPKAEKGGFVAEAVRGFQDGFADNLAGSLYNLNQRMSGGQEIGDTSVAVEPSLLGPLGRATGAVAGAVTDPVGRAIDYFTGGFGGRALSRGVQAVNPVRQVTAAAIPGAVSGAIQGAGTVAAQGGDANDMIRAGGLGLAGGAFFGNRAYGKNAPSGPVAAAPSPVTAPARPAPAGPGISSYVAGRGPKELAQLRNHVAAKAARGDAKAQGVLRSLDSAIASRQGEIAGANRTAYAAQDTPSGLGGVPQDTLDLLAARGHSDQSILDTVNLRSAESAGLDLAPSRVDMPRSLLDSVPPETLSALRAQGFTDRQIMDTLIERQRDTVPDFLGLSLDPNRAVDAGAAPSAAASSPQPNLAHRILTDEEGGMPIPNFGKIAEALVSDVGPARRQAAQAADNLVRAPRTPSGEKYAASVNLNRLDADDSVKATIESVAQSYKGQIDEARRGTITHEETLRMAEELGISEKRILSRKAGEAWNAEQLLAARRVMMDTATELDGLAQKVIDGQATDADKVLLMDALQRHAAVQAEVSGATSEAGRALSQFRIAAKAGKAIPDIQTLMADLGGAGKVEDVAAAILAAPAGPQRNKLIRDLGRARPTDVLSELFINSILSGPKTHITNAVGNSITVAARMAETAVAAGIGKAGELVGAGPSSTKFGEVTAQAYGSLQGLKEGAKLAAQVYRTGKSSGRFAPNEVERPGAISSQRLGLTGTPGKVADQVGKVVRIPGRALLSADEFFKSVHYRMDLHSQAYRQAASEGLKGPALAERVADLVDNPSESMLDKARESAAYHTFNKPLKGDDPFTTVARSLSAARVNAPSISFIIPFIRTPANILKYAGERTPLAPLSKAIREDIKAGGARREQALSRIAVGTTLGASVLAYALEGHITGGGPTDPREREALRATGWQPYSIKTGDTYVSFQRLAPFGMIAGAAADVADILERSQSNDEKFNAVAALLTAAANNATSQTFLQGLTDFTEVLQDPDRYAGGYAGGFARALVPNVIRQAATAADPVVRDTKGDGGLVDSIVGGVVSGLPQSTSLPEKLDSFGQPIVREQSSVGPIPASVVSYLNPLYTSRDKNDPVRDELYRLRVFAGSPKNTDGLPDDQFEEFVRSSGQSAYQLVARIIASPAYQNPSLKDEDKAEVLRRAMRLSRTRSRRSVPRI